VLELPELEVIRERLRLKLVGRGIEDARLYQQPAFRGIDATLQQLRAGRVRTIDRTGQHLVVSTDTGLILDFDFTRGGGIEMVEAGRSNPPGLAFLLIFSEGPSLCISDHRFPSRVAICLARDMKQLSRVCELGVDAFSPDFTLDRFRRVLRRRNRPVRHLLTDHRQIAGLGPACADEVLFEARLSPYATTDGIKPEESIRLYMAAKKFLGSAVVHYKNLPAGRLPDCRERDFLKVHRREGQPCPACATTIRLVRDGHIISHYCPACQTGGEVLADRNRPMLEPPKHA